MTSLHPHHEELHKFAAGLLSDEQSHHIEQHIEECESCITRLESLPRYDKFEEMLQEFVTERQQSVPQLLQQPLPTIKGYTLYEEIGRGGMGVVYRALDESLKREVALKVILAGEHSSDEHRRRLCREAETIAALKHPGIIDIYHIGETDGYIFLALELLEPRGLQNIIDGEQPLPNRVAEIVRQVAETIHFAHQNGVIHRDIKPENILFSASHSAISGRCDSETIQQVKLTDFGIAKTVNEQVTQTRTGVVMGTLSYMAPEQMPGSKNIVSPACDIYSIGVLLYHLLTGKEPFADNDVLRVIHNVRANDPEPPRKINPLIPQDLEIICLKSLAKDPQERYTTAESLAEDLSQFLLNRPIQAKGITLQQRLIRWIHRKPFLSGVWALLTAAYGFHLFGMLVLDLPNHQGMMHILITTAMLIFFPLAYVAQRAIDSPTVTLSTLYRLSVIPLVITAVITSLDQGPQTIPLTILPLYIMVSILIRPDPRLLWFVTTGSVITYLLVTLYSFYYQPQNLVNPQQAIFFILVQISTGAILHLFLRRFAIEPSN
ncbi:MAG: protein kinase [Candidatus Sedimenticola sp. (ex Thyasira tokunagai)]